MPAVLSIGVEILRWIDIVTRDLFANMYAAMPLQMRGIVDAILDPQAAALPQLLVGNCIRYQ